jgi:ubiquinone/menaquinone biosynthesis C-methylase UbiE
MKEAFFESFLRNRRLTRVLPYIRNYGDCRLLDIGCGWNYALLQAVEPYIFRGHGLDFKVPELQRGRLFVQQFNINDKLPFADDEFDVVTMLAVLEHLAEPRAVLREVRRVLQPQGKLLLTVPSHLAKPVLEFLAFRLGLVSADEIRDHKRYFNRTDLVEILSEAGLQIVLHQYFQLGMNNFCVAS